MITAILRSEGDDSTWVESEPVPLSNRPSWSHARLSLDGFDLGTNRLLMDFVVDGYRLVRFAILTGQLNYYRHDAGEDFIVPDVLYSITIDDALTISYQANKYKEGGE